MDVKKVVFEADVDQIDIRPLLKKEFLELTMRAISTANPNRNNSWFTRESLVASIGSFKNKPILGYFENGDFVSHNGQWKEDPETKMEYWDTVETKGERPIGMIRSEDEVKVVDDAKTGLSWAVLTCALWTQYNYKQVKRLLKDAKKAKSQGGPTKNISVEVDITDWEMLENGVMKINAFNLVGITILGSRNGVKVEPGIEDAELSVVDIMGTALYEKQMQNLRLAYEKLDGSENKKEDFSKMDENIQENSTLVEETTTTPEATVTETVVEEQAAVEEKFEANEGSSQEEAHFEENHEDETSEPENNTEKDQSVRQVNEDNHDDDDDEEDHDEDICPECGKNPCICEHQEQEEVHENEEVNQEIIRDLAWLIDKCSWNIEDFGYAIGYYEAHEEIQGRDYILPVLRRLQAQAVANQQELAELMGKAAEEISPEEIQFQEDLCNHCDCKAEFNAYNELLCKYNDLVKECDALKEEKCALECKFEEIEKAKAHAAFIADAKAIINNAKLTEELAVAFEKSCDEGTITSLDELKTQIGLKLYEIKAAEENVETIKETVSFDAPINTPDTKTFIEENNKVKKTKWEALHEYITK